jgi:hypothetical protein
MFCGSWTFQYNSPKTLEKAWLNMATHKLLPYFCQLIKVFLCFDMFYNDQFKIMSHGDPWWTSNENEYGINCF